MRCEMRMDTEKMLQFLSRQVILICFWALVTFFLR